MELKYAEEIDFRCVVEWLYDICKNPSVAFSNHSNTELKELANDALVFLSKSRVVRCKDCKHHDKERTDRNMVWCKLHGFARPETHYCADGTNHND